VAAAPASKALLIGWLPLGAIQQGRLDSGSQQGHQIFRDHWRRRHGPGQGPVEAATAIRVLAGGLRPLPAHHLTAGFQTQLWAMARYGFRFAATESTRVTGPGGRGDRQGLVLGKPPPGCRHRSFESAVGRLHAAAVARGQRLFVIELGKSVVVALDKPG